MKVTLVLTACLFIYQVVKAQTWSEWFRQNHTQLSYLQDQIAALQTYNVTQQTGYDISEEGLMDIDSIGEEDELQHAAYFAALQTPAQSVLADPRIKEVDLLCEKCDLIAHAISTLGLLRNPKTADWTELGEGAATDIEQTVDRISEKLYDIILQGKTQMTDAQREQGIEELQSSARILYKKAAYLLELMTAQPILS